MSGSVFFQWTFPKIEGPIPEYRADGKMNRACAGVAAARTPARARFWASSVRMDGCEAQIGSEWDCFLRADGYI